MKYRLVVPLLVILMLITPLLVACGDDDDDEQVAPTKTVEKTVTAPTKTVEKTVEAPAETVEVPKEEKWIKVGGLAEITGPYAVEAGHVTKAFKDYFDWINEQGGIGDTGVKIKYIMQDTGAVWDRAITGYERIKGEGVFVMHTMTSSSTMPIIDKITDDEMNLMHMAPGRGLTVPYSWGAIPGYEDGYGATMQYLLENWSEDRPMRIGHLTIDLSVLKTLMEDDWTAWVEDQGAEVVAKEVMELVPLDLTPQLLRIKGDDADCVVGIYASAQGGVLLKGMEDLDMEIPVLQHWASGWDETFALVPWAENVVIRYMPFAPWDRDDIEGVKFAKDLQTEMHGTYVEHPQYMVGLHGAMIIVEALRLALEEVDIDDMDGAKLKEFGFEKIKDFDCMGLISPVTFGPDNNYSPGGVMIQYMENGELISTDWRPVPDTIGLKK